MAEIHAPSLQDEAQSLLVARCEGVYLTPAGRELVLRALERVKEIDELRARMGQFNRWQEALDEMKARAIAAEAKLTALRAVLNVSPAAPHDGSPPLFPSAESAGDFRNVTSPEWDAQLCTCGHPRSGHAEGATFCTLPSDIADGVCFCLKFTIASDSAAEVVGTPEVGTVDPKWGRVGESAWHIFIFNGISVAVCGEAIDAPAVYSQPTDPEQVCLDCLESGHPKALEYLNATKGTRGPGELVAADKGSQLREGPGDAGDGSRSEDRRNGGQRGSSEGGPPTPEAAATKKRNVPEACVIPGCANKGAARNQWCCTEHAAKLPLPERQAALAAWKKLRKSAPAQALNEPQGMGPAATEE